MKAQRMTESSEIQNLDRLRAAFLPVLHYIKAQRRRKLFHRDRILRANSIGMRDECARAGRDGESGHLGDLDGGLPDNLGVQGPAWSLHRPLELNFFLWAADVSTLFFQLLENVLLYGF